jgi:SAM-dependent methyltransferase
MVVILYLLITYQYSMASNTGCVPAESSDIREAQYIGLVYNSISADFSRTRYKVWPCVSRFLDQIINESTTPSFLVGEIGCGNGKNLAYLSGNNDRIKTIGVDISSELLNICRLQGLEVVLGSILNIPLNDHTLDYTLSVAVIHHLRDRADRIRALRELARVTRLGGRCLITVWARVQNEGDGKRRFATNDEMVPFKTKTGETHYRFYHLYDDGELADDLAHLPEFRVANLFIERGNYIAELVRVKQQFKPN